MCESQTSLSVLQELSFQSLIAGNIDINVDKIALGEDVYLYGQVSLSDALKVFDTGTFHVDQADEPSGWETGVPVDIALRLRGPIAKVFNDVDTFTSTMLEDSASALRHTESWLLLEAMQQSEVPGMPGSFASFGVRTDWADPISEM